VQKHYKAKYLIIGASAAGLSAAETLRRVDPGGHVSVLCRERRPYSRVLLPYLLAGAVSEETAFLPVPKGVELLGGKEVVKVDPQKKEVITASGDVFSFDKLLIATGASPVRPQIAGTDQPFVFTVREISDVQGIQVRAKKGKRAIVVGAGPVGMRVGEALHRLGMRVTFIEMAPSLLPRILDPPASAIIEKVLAQRGIEIIKGDKVVQILEGEVCLESGERRKCDLVVLAMGVRPNVTFLQGSGIEVQWGIVVNKYQQTTVADIYAAGDVAESLDIVCEKQRINALWSVAKEQGRIAGLNMASFLLARYNGSIARNTIHIFDIPIFALGMSCETGEGLKILRKQGTGFYRKIVLKEGVLKGALFIGKLRGGGLYLSMAYRRLNISSFAEHLIKGAFNSPFLLCRYHWQVPLEDYRVKRRGRRRDRKF